MRCDEQQVIKTVRTRLFREVLYELQTGGGIAIDCLCPGDTHHRTLASIRKTVSNLKGLFTHAPERVACQVTRANQRVLDVGAGRAPWSIAIARAARATRVTAIDLPDQIPMLQQSVEKHSSLLDQFTIIGVDLFSDEWFHTFTQNEYDLILVANVCHLFNEFGNRQLFQRIVPLLKDDGRIAVIDQVLEEDPDWLRWAALYALGVLHCAPGGYLFPVRQYAEWFVEHGSWNVIPRPICPLPPLTLILADRA
jgi:SAM-dependent methyltransferase